MELVLSEDFYVSLLPQIPSRHLSGSAQKLHGREELSQGSASRRPAVLFHGVLAYWSWDPAVQFGAPCGEGCASSLPLSLIIIPKASLGKLQNNGSLLLGLLEEH